MKTAIIFDSYGYEEIKFFVVEGKYSHLNDIYIESGEPEKQKELKELLYDSQGKFKMKPVSRFEFQKYIFKEDAEFYWTRSRILEKLNSLPSGTLPQGVSPHLGPDVADRDRQSKPSGRHKRRSNCVVEC